jgi:type II secretory pathway pseudopilin PulG
VIVVSATAEQISQLNKNTEMKRKRKVQNASRRAFTLVQIIVVIAIIGLLASILLGVIGRGHRAALRSTCDVHLKAIVMALDAYRQETGNYPTSLSQLIAAKYITDTSMLHCPRDPKLDGTYDEFYMFRGARPNPKDTRDANALPLVVCPFHEEDSGTGVQGFRTGTKQFAASPATVNSTAGATIYRPGKDPEPARAGMTLRGGDRVVTEGGGETEVKFADGSLATLQPDADMTVIQSFIDGNSGAPLYTVVRQHLGEIFYHVNHGSKFDVATPTATAGALGTKFYVKRDGENWYLKVVESKVLCAAPAGSKIYEAPVGLAPSSASGWNLIDTETSVRRSDDDSGGGSDDDDRRGS